MAVRGVLSSLLIYPENRQSNTLPLYSFQNFFPGSRTLPIGSSFVYNSYTVGSISDGKDSSTPDLSITFSGTAANIDLVDAAITNRYIFLTAVWRLPAADIENPASGAFNLFAMHYGYAKQAESDFTSIALTVGDYNDSQEPDFPWRKIPWTILGPLGVRL
jgi:hypothetical protein